MAELIPLQYRIRVASRYRIDRWIFVATLVFMGCLAASLMCLAWNNFASRQVHELQNQHTANLSLIARSQELRAKREDLAQRMRRIQQLMDDRTLLAVLNSAAASFGDHDCMEAIEIDQRPPGVTKNDSDQHNDQPQTAAPDDIAPRTVQVRITGITDDAASLSRLMQRLNHGSDPHMNVTLEFSRREHYLDGSVMRFQLVCRRPQEQS